jgi:hypothetical protein
MMGALAPVPPQALMTRVLENFLPTASSVRVAK